MSYSAQILPFTHCQISTVLLPPFYFGKICQAKVSDRPPILPIERAQNALVYVVKAPNPSVPMEILSYLTLHGSWSWETKNIVTTSKINGGRNHILYLHSSICGCKGLHKGGCLQPLHIQGKTCVLYLKIDHTIKIKETRDLDKLVADCSAMSNNNS